MAFRPPRCPNRDCRAFQDPAPHFYLRWGSYRPKCRNRRVPRFRCRTCRRTFSRQTFRPDYRDRRPDANIRVLSLLASGVGLRQSGRETGLRVYAVQRKATKLGRHLASLHDNLARDLPGESTYLLDEEETYEQASILRLTVPIVIERRSWMIIAASVGSIRRLAPAETARRRRQDAHERRFGPRQDESRRCLTEVLENLGRRAPTGLLTLQSDEKPLYGALVREIFGVRARHELTSGKDPRTPENALFAINSTITMARDTCGRLRPRSWLVSKRAAGLANQLSIHIAYRNYVRVRFNRDQQDKSAATVLGLVPRRMTWGELMRWRQDWQLLSPSPLCPRARRTVGHLSRRAS